MSMLMLMLWALGFGLCCAAGVEVKKRVEQDPFSYFSTMFVAIAGFACFPVINYLVAATAFYMLTREKP